MKAKTVLVLISLLLIGCDRMNVEDFVHDAPEFVPEEYFQGRTLASGLFMDRFGNVRRQFVVTIDGTWDGTKLRLNEDFVYSDGETENRIWTLARTGDFSYSGDTANAIGIAKGSRRGNAFNWKYKFNLKVGDGFWKVKFDDWIFLQPDGTLLNVATITRWGIKLGTVYLSFNKPAGNAGFILKSVPELPSVSGL
ncbi:MAG: DUF3833 domain-containing protein [Gammaproteobacteria bacterium]|jgi:hypothetical protein|nr:DUF3833 domain-containing protein [Gammaproteobacteria bacterium]HJP04960.1 DUF3833 domain-containing protein [Gammaproteobacteria bacterium]